MKKTKFNSNFPGLTTIYHPVLIAATVMLCIGVSAKNLYAYEVGTNQMPMVALSSEGSDSNKTPSAGTAQTNVDPRQDGDKKVDCKGGMSGGCFYFSVMSTIPVPPNTLDAPNGATCAAGSKICRTTGSTAGYKDQGCFGGGGTCRDTWAAGMCDCQCK